MCWCFTANAAGALAGESIVLDSNTGDYLITYVGTGSPGNKQDRPLRQTKFVPATKIIPALNSRFRLHHQDIVDYNYRVRNGSASQQSLISFRLDPVSDIVSSSPLPKSSRDVSTSGLSQINKIGKEAIHIPQHWDGRVWVSEAGGLRISWGYVLFNSASDGLIAGANQEGFGFTSRDMPGMGIAQLEGNSPVFGYVDRGPQGDIADQLEVLRRNNYVPRPAAVPTIAVPNPFDAAVMLDRIRTQAATWPGKQLLDPAFAVQLDRYMTAAADAFRRDQPKVGKEQIESLRRMLDREHKYLDHDDEDNEDTPEHKHATRLTIDRLAARVLDFDLRYVLKRTEREHGQEHDKGDKRKDR